MHIHVVVFIVCLSVSMLVGYFLGLIHSNERKKDGKLIIDLDKDLPIQLAFNKGLDDIITKNKVIFSVYYKAFEFPEKDQKE